MSTFEDMLVASHRPGQPVDKAQVHLLGEALDAKFLAVDATNGGNRIFATTLAALTATASNDGDFAVLPKSAGSDSGLYLKVFGTWVKQAELLDLAAAGVVPLTVSNSDGDALVVTSATPLPSSHAGMVFTLTVPATNDTEGATIAINGATAIPILTSTGGALPADYLPPNAVIILTSRGDALQLISHDDAAAASRVAAAASATAAAASATTAQGHATAAGTAQTAAETAQAAAETAAATAQGVALGNTSGVPNVSNVPGSTATDALNALYATNKGSSRPANAVAGTTWLDDTGTPWLLKQYDGAADILLARINATDNTIEWAESAEQDVASATTTNLVSKTGRNLRITGTTTITGLGTADAGVEKALRFAAALTLTHNATSLILPSGANIVTAAGDVAVMRSEGSGNWRCVSYTRASGEALVQPASGANYDDDIAVLAMGLADALNVAQFLGDTGNRFADNFDALTYVDNAGATNLDAGEAGVLKPTASGGSDQTATHTAATTGGNTASASSQVTADYAGWKAFNKAASSGTSFWNSAIASFPHWLQYEFGSAQTIASYTIASGPTYASRAPNTWTLQGSNTGAFAGEEATLDTRSGEASWSGSGETRTYSVSSPGSYTHYRLVITAVNGDADNYAAIEEMELLTAGSTSNLTVETTGLTAAAAPDAMKSWLVIEEVDSVTLNTDLTVRFSRDGGSTFTSATLAQSYALPGGKKLVETNSANVSGQPSGTTPVMEIATANAKMVKIHSHALYWS